jgi:hypothetical protein
MAPFSFGRARHCTIRTRSGDVEALLQRLPNTLLPTERDSHYVVYLRLPRPDGRSTILLDGRSVDSAGHVEQIAIAQSLRLLSVP